MGNAERLKISPRHAGIRAKAIKAESTAEQRATGARTAQKYHDNIKTDYETM